MSPDQLAAERAKYGIPAQGYGAQPTQDATAQRLAAFDAAVAKATPPKPTGFVSNVQQDVAQRQANVQGVKASDQNIGSKILQTVGQSAGLLFGDLPLEALKSVNSALGGLPAKAFTDLPGPVNSLLQIMKSPQAQQGMSTISKGYQELKEKHPEAVGDLEALFNIASVAPVGIAEKGAANLGGEAMSMAGKGLQASAKASTEKGLADYALQLVRPEETKATLTSEVGRTTETGMGPFRGSVVTPTYSEARAAEHVAQVPGISPKATLQRNFNAIKEANVAEAKNLEDKVAANNFVIPRKEVVGKMKAVQTALRASPLIVGDAQKMASRLIQGATRIIGENEGTGSGLLKAKKDYDKWVLDQKPKAFDAKAENAFTMANREIRNVFKDVLDKNAPNAEVKASLAKQTALYDAMENIAPKAAYEANTAFGRALQRVGTVLGTKNRVVQTVAAAAGIGGLGAAATFAPIVAGAGIPAYLIYRGGKLILNPKVRGALGKLLETAGNAMNPADRRLLRGALDGKDIHVPKDEGGAPKVPDTSRYSSASKKTVEAFDKSTGQKDIGPFELGNFGRKNADKKSLQGDRFSESQIEDTSNNITSAYRGSNDPTNYRYDNIAWISRMPDGEQRVIYTRLNPSGKEEILNWHTVSNPQYIEDLKKFGAPDRSRTDIISLERSNSSPLNYGDGSKDTK